MLLIKTWYYIFAAFVYALAGICVALQAIRKGQWNMARKGKMPLKDDLLPLLRLHH